MNMRTVLLIAIFGLLTSCMSWSERQAQNRKEENDERRNTYIKFHPETSVKMKEIILSGSIAIGMTKEQAIASWGKPQKNNRTVTKYGVREQWCYGVYSDSWETYLHVHTYVYFNDGKLSSWQGIK